MIRWGAAGEGGWSYEYVPGAGDDEESWARGLTPALLMRHRRVRCAPCKGLVSGPILG